MCEHAEYAIFCLHNQNNLNLEIELDIGSEPFFKTLLIMSKTACVVIVICGILAKICTLQERYLYGQLVITTQIPALIFQGLMFLVYPLLGHIADVCLNRYRTIKWSFAPVIGGKFFAFIGLLISIVIAVTKDWNVSKSPYNLLLLIPSIGVLLSIIGAGLYESNIIQFGLDQLLEAPTRKLIVFIHWFYWAQNFGSFISFYASWGLYFGLKYTIPKKINFKQFVLDLYVIEMSIVGLVVCKESITLLLFMLKRKHFYIERAGLNPFKNIYKVLKYSWNHKFPEHRSAFTYWEEDIPHRIDLGKNKYGGPFTNEEVEDTKTFLRIVPLLLCLFGYHLAGDGYSAPLQLQRTSCPSLPVLLLIVVNPLHMSTLVVVVCIPLYRLVIKKIRPDYKGILLLTRMWIGLFLCLVQVTIYINIVLNHDTTYWQQHHIKISRVHKISYYSPTSICLSIRKKTNFSLAHHNDPIDNTYLWLIIPQLLNGLSSLLVSMTVFEFICAQAPRSTKGLLIGLWYATFSIRYLVVGVLDNLIIERRSWLICEGVKWFLVLVSLVLFSCVSRRYQYRQRDEIVNVQGMIEDTHERWFDQEEEHMKERASIFQSNRFST